MNIQKYFKSKERTDTPYIRPNQDLKHTVFQKGKHNKIESLRNMSFIKIKSNFILINSKKIVQETNETLNQIETLYFKERMYCNDQSDSSSIASLWENNISKKKRRLFL